MQPKNIGDSQKRRSGQTVEFSNEMENKEMRLLYLEKGKNLEAKECACSFYDHGDVKLPVTHKTTV